MVSDWKSIAFLRVLNIYTQELQVEWINLESTHRLWNSGGRNLSCGLHLGLFCYYVSSWHPSLSLFISNLWEVFELKSTWTEFTWIYGHLEKWILYPWWYICKVLQLYGCVLCSCTFLWYSFLVAAMVFQCMWSLCLGILDAYALLLKRSLRNSLLVSLFVVGDWVRSSYL